MGCLLYELSTLITEPTSVKELLEEVTEHTILLWWDERAQEIKMDSLLNSTPQNTVYNDDEHIVADSVKVARDDKSRVTQTWVSIGHRNPVLDMSELKNFSRVQIVADLELEGVNAYDLKKVNRFTSRWLPSTEANVASEIVARLNNYYKNTKKVITMTLDSKDDSIWTGDIIQVQTRQLQNEFGAAEVVAYRILQVNEKQMPGKTSYSYVLQDIGEAKRQGNISPALYTTEYDSATDEDKAKYAFIAPDSDGFPSDDGLPYQVI